MNAFEFLQWGAKYNYPYLSLGDGMTLQHGRFHYHFLVEEGSRERLERAIARVEAWEARVSQAQKVEAQV